MARFNRSFTNRATRSVAGWLPGFGVVIHEGRRTGRRYRTPVNVFRTPDGPIIALTYGVDSDWVANVRSAGRCELITRGRRLQLREPEIVHGDDRDVVPAPVRAILGLIRVTDFLRFGSGRVGTDLTPPR